jgi:hypothetical protein
MYESRLEDYNHSIIKTESRLIKLKKSNQPKTEELYNGIEAFFTIKNVKKKYENILGGDGRSSAWSENKEGKVLEVTILEGVYLSEPQIKVLREYIEIKYNPEKMEVKHF